MATERMCSIRSVRTVRPLGRTVRRRLRSVELIVMDLKATCLVGCRLGLAGLAQERRPKETRIRNWEGGARLQGTGKCSILGPAVTQSPNQLLRLDTNRQAGGSPRALFGLDAGTLTARMTEMGEPGWRGRQLAEALYRQWVTELAGVTTLPLALRRRLEAEGWEVGRARIVQAFVSQDGTERYLVERARGDGLAGVPGGRSTTSGTETVETVWMPEGDSGEAGDGSGSEEKGWERATICVSSQVGCAVGCQFCLTAKLGLQRNLTAGEIAGQVVAVLDRQGVEVGKDRVNLVFMGMGEPLLNYEAWMAAVRLLVEEVGLSPQRMTVSTSGIVPGIERLAEEPAEVRPKLAISLNAPNDEVRSEIMPINRKWPLSAVMEAVQKVRLRPRERVTFEYVLLGGVTDRPEHAREVARLVRRTGLPAKVNLIAWNPGPGIAYAMPQPDAMEAFKRTLVAEGVPVYVRRPRGRDIYAACGQLKRTVEGAGSERPS
ncbi:MAG TPA: 23S rRNA (adenine(2503)-C(2))-methyltransferase RlmN [Terracidiphilus sp.]|nr:23S rRNA (adenine(2503)-C(2))-methyltransferase RlmN [Terracidiphilus sp.]